jgi:hypothetical protein
MRRLKQQCANDIVVNEHTSFLVWDNGRNGSGARSEY